MNSSSLRHQMKQLNKRLIFVALISVIRNRTKVTKCYFFEKMHVMYVCPEL